MNRSDQLKRRALRIGAAVLVAAAVAGCSTTTKSNTTGPRWLVKVEGDFANVYAYPPHNFAGTPHAVRLGLTFTQAQLDAAARRLGVPPGNVTPLGS